MYATNVFYSQIYPSLLTGRQFPGLASVYPPASLFGALPPEDYCPDLERPAVAILRFSHKVGPDKAASQIIQGGYNESDHFQHS